MSSRALIYSRSGHFYPLQPVKGNFNAKVKLVNKETVKVIIQNSDSPSLQSCWMRDEGCGSVSCNSGESGKLLLDLMKITAGCRFLRLDMQVKAPASISSARYVSFTLLLA